MQLKDFVDGFQDLKKEAVRSNLLYMLREALYKVEINDGDYAIRLMKDGIIDVWVDIEDDDSFGTEGLIRE